jgi:hypothetical protein
LQNVVNYYLKRQSNVYIVTLDASAAFDRVNVYALLSKLIDKEVSPEIVRVLLSWYSTSHACVRMDDIITDNIDIRSGVKQGGIMSPLLYNVYVDDLMTKLIGEKLGCTIGEFTYSAIFYADDIVLVSGSRRKMQRMIDICNEYGIQYGICFNATKSKWFFAGKHNDCNDCTGVSFKLGDHTIDHEWHSLSYLGVKFVMKRHVFVIDVEDRVRKFNCSAYSVLLNSNDLSDPVRCEIVVKKCLPVLMYGMGCGHLWSTDMYKMHIAYRKIFRHIFKLSLRTHLSELLDVFGIESIENVLNKKKIRTLHNCMHCCFPEICFLSKCVDY